MRFNEELASIATYQAGKPIEEVVRNFGLREQDIIKLASNENPYGTSARVVQAIKDNAHKAHLYPDDSMRALIERLCAHYHIKDIECIIGAGSDQIIELCMHAKTHKGSKILIAGVTFAMYEIYAKHIGVEVIKTPSQTHDLTQLYELFIQHRPDVVFLCVPNNPLGECLGRDEVYEFIDRIGHESDGETLVVLDGAYQEFAAYKDSSKRICPHDLVSRFSHVIYLGTFSKAYGLGGMRVGYGIAQASIIQALYKLRAPFNITTLSLVAACEVFDDMEFVERTIESNFVQMRRYEEFAESRGISYIPSYTNFITFVLSNPYDSSVICDTLLREGIIIRDLASYGINAFRITIGTQEQNDRVLCALGEIFSS